MYPNLLGQQAYAKLTMEDMAEIIGVSRQSWYAKIESGRFTASECKTLCNYFGKSFEYLFATADEIEN